MERSFHPDDNVLTIGLEPITFKEQILSLPCLPISPSKQKAVFKGKRLLVSPRHLLKASGNKARTINLKGMRFKKYSWHNPSENGFH